MNLRILIHYDRIRNAGKSGWARYMVLSSFFLLLLALVFINSLVLLIGFELNVSIKTLKARAEQRDAKEKLQLAAQKNT